MKTMSIDCMQYFVAKDGQVTGERSVSSICQLCVRRNPHPLYACGTPPCITVTVAGSAGSLILVSEGILTMVSLCDTSWIGFEIGSGSKSLILTNPLCHLWHSSFMDQDWLVYAVLILPLSITRTPAKKTSGQTFHINLRSKVWLAWLITCADSWKSFFWVFVERDRVGNLSADFTCQVQKGVAKVCPSMSPSLYSSLRHHFFPILHFCVWSITCPHDAIIPPLSACACQYMSKS